MIQLTDRISLSSGDKYRTIDRSSSTPSSSSGLNYLINQHRRWLSSSTPLDEKMMPLMVIYTRPEPGRLFDGSSEHVVSPQAAQKYNSIQQDLDNLHDVDASDPDKINPSAINTARSVVGFLRQRGLAPPQLSQLDREAIVMLWVLGDTKYALTVTDGELGFVVRRDRQTIRRQHSLPLWQIERITMAAHDDR